MSIQLISFEKKTVVFYQNLVRLKECRCQGSGYELEESGIKQGGENLQLPAVAAFFP